MPASTDSNVARRYSQALFDLVNEGAGKDQKIQATLGELKALNDIFLKNPATQEFFESPVIARTEKWETIDSLQSLLPSTHSFLKTLVAEDRVNSFHEIVARFSQLVESAGGVVSVEVRTARPPSAALLQEIQDFLEDSWSCKVSMKTSLDPALVGGFLARAEGREVDASVRTQLAQVERAALASI